MLRNLLYSFFFHVLFIALLFVSTFEFDTKIIKSEITPLTISFLNDNAIDDIKSLKIKKENEKVKDLSIDEKIDLYNKIKKSKEAMKENKVVYEKSEKKLNKKQNVNVKDQIMSNEALSNEENEFSYYYTPIYIAEEKVNTEEKRKLIENRLKREELRRKIKEKNIVPKVDISEIKQIKAIEDIVKISQKPLIVKKTKNDEKKLENENNINDTYKNEAKLEQESSMDVSDLVTEINVSTNAVDDKYKDVNEDEIFNEEDYNKLKEIEENKEDTKYMLSLREKRNIQRQIKGCYKMAILRSKKDSKAIVALSVKVESDGIINVNSVKVNKIVDNFDKVGFQTALENAKSALVFCSPLRGLPSAKYKAWKQMTFVFDSNNLE